MGDEVINSVIKGDCLEVMKQIPKKSKIIQDLVKKNKIALIGGMYDVSSGKVDFY